MKPPAAVPGRPALALSTGGKPPGIRRLIVLAGCVLATCACGSSAPEVTMTSGSDGTRCVTAASGVPEPDRERVLLFHCAQATLEAGGRYFLVTGTSSSREALSPGRPQARAGVPSSVDAVTPSDRTVCFGALRGGSHPPAALDAREVVLSAEPALARSLSRGARERLQAIEREEPR